MIAPESNHPGTPGAADGAGSAESREVGIEGPVDNYRGGTVNVDIRKAGQVVIGVCLVALTVLGLILLIAAVNNNNQINNLKDNGVPVAVTVTGCEGLIGGTGQSTAGFSCTGSYRLDGTPYHQNIPGLAFHRPGTTIRGVAVPGDPKLLSTPDQLARQHASLTAFVIPGLLLLVVVVALVILLLRRSGRSASSGPDGTAAAGPR
jgi:hypothetical protein